jgi:hypothetical protein
VDGLQLRDGRRAASGMPAQAISTPIHNDWGCRTLPGPPWNAPNPLCPAIVSIADRTLPHTRPRERALLVATLGLRPAATSHAIGSDSGQPFAIVIVGGSIVDLVMSALLVPAFSAWWGRPIDSLPPAEDPRSVHE